MQSNHLGHLAQGQGFEVLDTLVEEVTLPVDNEPRNLEHRLASLLDCLHEPVRRVHARLDEFALFGVEIPAISSDSMAVLPAV